jgi:hypothetical protein
VVMGVGCCVRTMGFGGIQGSGCFIEGR